jgi:flagellin
MRINHNMSALNAWRNETLTQGALGKTLERLSSGLRINRAADDAAGLAISEKMRGQIHGLDMASKNAQDGISLIQTAEGALNETHSILQRMRELSVQASSDTNTADDRSQIQKEIDQLVSEIDRISTTTEFNTKKVLTGRLSFNNSTSNPSVINQTSINAGSAEDGKFGIQFSNPFANHEVETKQAYGEFSFKSINGTTLSTTANKQFTIKVGTASKTFTAAAGAGVSTIADDINGTAINGVTIYASDADNNGQIEIWANKNFALNDVDGSLFNIDTADHSSAEIKFNGENTTNTAFNLTGNVVLHITAGGTGSLAITVAKTEAVSAVINDIDGKTIDGVVLHAADSDGDGNLEIWADGNGVTINDTTGKILTAVYTFAAQGNYTKIGASETKRFDSGDTDAINPETTNYVELNVNADAANALTIYVGGDSKKISATAAGLTNLINAINGSTVGGVTLHAADLDGDGKIEIWASKRFDVEDKNADAVFIEDNWIGNNDDYVSPMVLKGVDMGDGTRSAITLVGYTVGQMTTDSFNANTLNSTTLNTHVYARDLDSDGNIEFYANKAGSDYSFKLETLNSSDTWTAATYTGTDTLADVARVESTQALTGSVGIDGTLLINGVAVDIAQDDSLSNVMAKINAKSDLTQVTANDNDGDYKLNLQQMNLGSKNTIVISGDNSLLQALGLTTGTTAGKDAKISYNTTGSTDTMEATVQGSGSNYAETDGNNVVLGTDTVGGDTSATGTANEVSGSLINFKLASSFNLNSYEFNGSIFDSSYAANGLSGPQESVTIDSGDSLKLHIGANKDQTMTIEIQDMSADSLGVEGLDVTTQAGAEAAITKVDAAIEKVSTQRAQLGAFQNRLEHTITNLGVASENLTAAESRIRDADMAKEMVVFTKQQVLMQSATSMLTHANGLSQQVLQLLR